MNHLQKAGAAAYGVSFVLLFFPLLDVVQAAWPVNAGEVSWRVITAGLLSRILITPMLGLLLAFVTALVLRQQRVLRALSAFTVLLMAAVAVGLPFYALDALQIRSQVTLESRESFDFGLALSFVKYGVVVLLLGLMAWSQWRAAGSLGRESGRRSSASPLVFKSAGRTQARGEAVEEQAAVPEPHHG